MLETKFDRRPGGPARDDARCFDTDFRDLMRDPFGRVEALQTKLGVDLGDRATFRDLS